MLLDTTSPGHILMPGGSGVMLYRGEQDKGIDVPLPTDGARYLIGATYHVTDQTAFSQGFWDQNGVSGFGVEFSNRVGPGADDVFLVVNGKKFSLLRGQLSFDFSEDVLTGDAYLEYGFTFTHEQSNQWNVSGELLNGKGAPILRVDYDFVMSDFEAERFGALIDPLLLPSPVGNTGANEVVGLSWRVLPVPEPSSLLSIALSGVILMFRRKRNSGVLGK